MAQKQSPVDIAYDWELWIGRDSNDDGTYDSWTQIFGFEDLPFPDQVPEEIDVTHLNSPGRTRETRPGMISAVDWSQEKQLWPSDAGDVLLETLAALTAAGNEETVLIEFNIRPDGSSIRRTYRGYVNSYNPMGTVGDKEMGALSVKIFERQPSNVRVIA